MSSDRGDASALDDDDCDWFRVVPSHPEFSAQDLPAVRSKRAPPAARAIAVDRKIIGPEDLIDAGFAPNILCSRRFLDALGAAGATNWTAKAAKHVTKRSVAGHPVFELVCPTLIGTLVDTELHGVQRVTRAPSWGRAGAPVPPVTIAPAKKETPLIGWTEWLEVEGPQPWRGLIVHRRVVEALARTWRVPLGLDPVSIPGAVPGRGKGAAKRVPADRALSGAATVEAIVDRLRKTASKQRHLLPPPPASSAVNAALKRVGLPTRSGLERVLAAANGPILFGGALAFCSVGKRDVDPDLLERSILFDLDDLVREQRMRRAKQGGVDVPDGWWIFARGYTGGIYWTMNKKGDVRGYAQVNDGVECGPDAPFERWLADMIADIELARASPKRAPWAVAMTPF